MTSARRNQRGFTLVEVMVALLVVGLALPAVLTYLYQISDSTAYLRDKSLAQMVAANRLTELRLASRARNELFKGRDSGLAEMADREWYWQLESKVTQVPEFYRVEIQVSAAEEGEALYTLVAFLTGDLRPDLTAPGPNDES